MSVNEEFVQNFQSLRNRSMKLWFSLSEETLYWRPNSSSATCLEIIRLVLESEVLHFLHLLKAGDQKSLHNPVANFSFTTVENEINQSQVYREKFLKLIYNYRPEDFKTLMFFVNIPFSEVSLTEYLLLIMRQESEYYGLIQAYSRLHQELQKRA